MTTNTIAIAIAAISLTTAANAEFTGFTGQSSLRYYAADGNTLTDLDNASFAVLDLSLQSDSIDNVLLSMWDTNFTSNGFTNFWQQDIASTSGNDDTSGIWAPQLSTNSDGAISNIDSFVTIGGEVGDNAFSNVTGLDPNFGSGDNANIFNSNIGWYVNDPLAYQGSLDESLEILIARLVVTGDEARAGASFDILGNTGYNQGFGTEAQFTHNMSGHFFIPTPGAVALLAIGGIATRRRRR